MVPCSSGVHLPVIQKHLADTLGHEHATVAGQLTQR